jgi:hypothetical protein
MDFRLSVLVSSPRSATLTVIITLTITKDPVKSMENTGHIRYIKQ